MAAQILSKVLPFLNGLLPAAISIKGLEKVDPKFAKFFSTAIAAGFGTDQALSYLRDKFIPGNKKETGNLKERENSGMARPDELAALGNIENSQRLPNALQKGAAVGAGLAAGMAIPEEVAPKNEGEAIPLPHTPQSESERRRSEFNEQRHQNATNTLQARQNMQTAPNDSSPRQIEYVKPQQVTAPMPEQAKPEAVAPKASPSNDAGFLKFLEQFPELGTAVQKEMAKGADILTAARSVKTSNAYRSRVARMEEKFGEPFEDMIARLFGSPSAPKAAPIQKATPELRTLIDRYRNLKGKK